MHNIESSPFKTQDFNNSVVHCYAPLLHGLHEVLFDSAYCKHLDVTIWASIILNCFCGFRYSHIYIGHFAVILKPGLVRMKSKLHF